MPTVGIPNVGVSGTWSVSDTDRIREVQRDVVLYEKKSSPLMTWLSMTQGRLRPTTQTVYEWYENQYDYGTQSVTLPIAGGAPTEQVIINNPAVIAGDTFCNGEDNQYFIVDQIVSYNMDGTTTCVLKLLPSGGNIQAIPGPITLVSCGNNMIENGNVPDAKGTVPIRLTNSITKSAASIEVTIEEANSPNYWGMKWANDKEAAIAQFRKDMERNLLLSKYFVETNYTQHSVNGDRVGTLRGTRGLVQTVRSNIQPYAGNLDKKTLDAWFRTGVWPSKYSGSATKFTLWGPDARKDITTDLQQQIRLLQMGTQMYGINISSYLYGDYRVIVMTEPEFYDISPYRKGIIAVDPANLYMRQYGTNLMEVKDTTLPRAHTYSMSMISMYGFQYEMEQSAAILKQPG